MVRGEYHRLDRGSTASGSGHIQNDYIADPCSVASDRLHKCRILRLCIRCSVAVHKTLTAGTLSRNSKHGHGQTPCSIIKTDFGTCRSNVPRNRRFLVCERYPRSRQRGNPTATHRWVGVSRFAVSHLCPRLESSGEVMKGDSRLCQPAGTPIFTQTGRRLRVTFVVDVQTDVLRPIHISVERIPVAVVVFFTHVQTTLNTLTLVRPPAHTTRFARVAL